MTTARAASTVARTTRSWAECSVYIRISPRPRNIAESKEVLRVLQQYGEVVMYRHLKYEAPNPTPNAAVAIYKTENSAKDVVNASPIRFQLKQGSDEWMSKTSRVASSQGLGVVSSGAFDAQSSNISDQNIRVRPSFQEIDSVLQDDTRQEESEPQADYPCEDSPEMEGNSLFKPEEGESGFLEPTLQSQVTASGLIRNAVEAESTKNDGGLLKKKRVKSAQRFVEDLTAALKSSIPKQGNGGNEKVPAPIREFELTVAQSILNHQAHIERQAYYAGFNPDMKTIMAEDLKGRVPMAGLLDCSLNKPEVPLRVRLRRKESSRSPVSLMELWQKGRKDRGEI